MDLGLEGRAAIVTGASRGIGRAVAERLVAEGASVLMVSRGVEDLAAAHDALAATAGAGRVAVCPTDVTDARAGTRVVDACLGAFGRVDVLVNNAGGATPKALEALTDADWLEGFERNLFSAVRLSAACAPVMAEAGWGRLIHVASISGREPDPAYAPYSAAKAALLNLSTSLAQAWGPKGVLSSCVVPGITLTELVEANAEEAAGQLGLSADEVMAKVLRRHRVPVGRFGQPEEVAAAVAFLAGETASWINGATLEVDGGTLRSV